MITASLILCRTPAVKPNAYGAHIQVDFLLDNLHVNFDTVSPSAFSYELDPVLHPLSRYDPSKPYRYKPGSVISVEVPSFGFFWSGYFL